MARPTNLIGHRAGKPAVADRPGLPHLLLAASLLRSSSFPSVTGLALSRQSGARAVVSSAAARRSIQDRVRAAAYRTGGSIPVAPSCDCDPADHPASNRARLHRLVCPCSSTSTCATLPADMETSNYCP